MDSRLPRAAQAVLLAMLALAGTSTRALQAAECDRLTGQNLSPPSAPTWTVTNRFLEKTYFRCTTGSTPNAYGCTGNAEVSTQASAHYAKAHLGTDYGAAQADASISVIGPGEVFAICKQSSCTSSSIGGFVIVKHRCDSSVCGKSGIVYSAYLHLAKDYMPNLAVGACIPAGQPLGRRAQQPEVLWVPHLHLELYTSPPVPQTNDKKVLLPPGAAAWGNKLSYALPRQIEETDILEHYADPEMFFDAVRNGPPASVPPPSNLRVETHDDGCTGCVDETNWTYSYTGDNKPAYTAARWDRPSNPRSTHYLVTFEGEKQCSSFRDFCAIKRESQATALKVVATGFLGTSTAAKVTAGATPPATDGRPPLVRTLSAGSRGRVSVNLAGETKPRRDGRAFFEVFSLTGQRVATSSQRRLSGQRWRKVKQRVNGLLCGTEYIFWLLFDPTSGANVTGDPREFKTKACRGSSNLAKTTPQAGLLTAPLVVQRDHVECDRIAISWQAEPDVDYEVRRDGVLLAPVDSSDELDRMEFWDTEGLVPGTSYLYSVTARDSSSSVTQNLLIPYPRHICNAPEQPVTEFTSWGPRGSLQCDGTSPAALVEWSRLDNADTVYDLLAGSDRSLLTSVDTAAQGPMSLVTAGLDQLGSAVELRVRGRDSTSAPVDTEAFSVRSLSARCDPRGRGPGAAPRSFLAWVEPVSCVNGQPAVRVRWTSSSGAISYRLERLHPNETLEWFDLSGRSFEDSSNLVPGDDYIYRVVAQSAAGETETPLAPVFIPSDICSSDGLPGEVLLFASEPYCKDGKGALDLLWYPSSSDVLDPLHRNIRTDLQGFGSVNTAIQEGPRFQTTKQNLEAGRVYGYFIQVALESDDSKRRESNRVFAVMPDNVCGLPPANPTVTTGSILSASTSAAVLAANITPNGASTQGWLEWGETTGYGRQTAPVDLGSGRRSVSLQPLIEGLQCGKAYHYRATAQQPGGPVVVGNDATFLTPGCPPGPPGIVTGAALYRNRTALTLTGTVIPNGGATQSVFEWGTDGSYGNLTDSFATPASNSVATVSYRITGLACGTEYYYRFAGTNAAGIVQGAGRRARTAACSEPDRGGEASYFTLEPCRLTDSRFGEPLRHGMALDLRLSGSCGVPPEASAVSVNVTVVSPSAGGHLEVHPRGEPPALSSIINFNAGRTRANNAIVPLGVDGEVVVTPTMASEGTLDLVIDVSGYFIGPLAN